MGRLSGGTVKSVFRRDRAKCWICRQGVNATEASRDHVNPRSAGGYDKAKNYRLAHTLCNNARGDLQESVVKEVYDGFTTPPTKYTMSNALMERLRESRRARH